MRIRPLLIAAALLAGAPVGAQEAFVDPFRGAVERPDTLDPSAGEMSALERAAVRRTRTARTGRPLHVATREVGGREMVLVRAWLEDRPEQRSVGYFVYLPAGPDSVILAWSTLADERAVRRGTGDDMYRVRGCLLVTGRGLAYLRDALPSNGRRAHTPPARTSGVWELRPEAGKFVRVADPSRALRARCGEEPGIIER